MLGAHLAVRVDETCSFSAREHFTLLFGEKFIAIGALVKVVLFLLKQKFELLHEKSTNDLVFAFFEHIEAVQAHFLGHLTDDVCVDAGHVDLDSGNFLDMLSNEVMTLPH